MTRQEGFTPELINFFYPIVAMKDYGTTIEVFRKAREDAPKRVKTSLTVGKRGKITYLSRKSLNRLACLARENTMIFKSMVTLTYGDPFPKDGRVVKRHLNNVLTYLRKKYDLEYLWFLEFQTERGAPHFHLLTTLVPRFLDRMALAEIWSNGVAHKWEGLDRVPFPTRCELRSRMFRVAMYDRSWEVLRKKDGVARYVTKYACKPEQKYVPEEYQNVGRFWGVSKGVTVPDAECMLVDEYDMRRVLDVLDHPAKDWDVVPKYVFKRT